MGKGGRGVGAAAARGKVGLGLGFGLEAAQGGLGLEAARGWRSCDGAVTVFLGDSAMLPPSPAAHPFLGGQVP